MHRVFSSFGRKLFFAIFLTLFAGPAQAQFEESAPTSSIPTALVPGERGAEQLLDVQNYIATDVANAVQAGAGITGLVGPTARCAFSNQDGTGYSASGPGIDVTGDTAGFSSTECSVIGSVAFDFSEAEIFGAGSQFSVGLFGGYANLDIDFDLTDAAAALDITEGNHSKNNSWLVGGYATVVKDGFYAVGSGAYMAGKTEITDRIEAAFADYDNSAYSASLTVGKYMALSGTWNIDVRGGLQYVDHTGDAFVDSVGNEFSESKVNYWQGQVSVGLFGAIPVNDVIYRPYVRAGISSKFGGESTINVNGVDFDFDNDDVLFNTSAGVNVLLSEKLNLNTEIFGDFGSDETTVGGKIGLKYQF